VNEFVDVSAAVAKFAEPESRDGKKFVGLMGKPFIDGGIMANRIGESE
jgi:hypothetical protein